MDSFQVRANIRPIQTSLKFNPCSQSDLPRNDLSGVLDVDLWRLPFVQQSECVPDRAPLHRLSIHHLADTQPRPVQKHVVTYGLLWSHSIRDGNVSIGVSVHSIPRYRSGRTNSKKHGGRCSYQISRQTLERTR